MGFIQHGPNRSYHDVLARWGTHDEVFFVVVWMYPFCPSKPQVPPGGAKRSSFPSAPIDVKRGLARHELSHHSPPVAQGALFNHLAQQCSVERCNCASVRYLPVAWANPQYVFVAICRASVASGRKCAPGRNRSRAAFPTAPREPIYQLNEAYRGKVVRRIYRRRKITYLAHETGSTGDEDRFSSVPCLDWCFLYQIWNRR